MQVDNFRGVYSTRQQDHTPQPPGTKTRKRYWLAWTTDDQTITVQPLGPDLEPSGAKRIISVMDFIEQYTHEPEVLPSFSMVDPGLQEGWQRSTSVPTEENSLTRNVHRQAVDLDDLDFLPHTQAHTEERLKEKESAALSLEHDTRAEFGMAITYLRRGDKRKAMRLFEKLTHGDFQPEHRHMFTDFGINLRKSKLLDAALIQHLKALELSPDDDHVHHNIARVYYEMGDTNNTVRHLKECLNLNPDLKPAKQFLAFLRKQQKSTRYTV